MANPISYPEAAKALAESLATGEETAPVYYITAAAPEETEDGTIYMVGYATADPEDYDEEGDPTLFVHGEFGVACMGPVF